MYEPDGLNPVTSYTATASFIQENIFSKLLEYNKENQELEPVLALQRPIIKHLTEGEFKGGLSLEYEIRPEATWDNGSPITGHDYLFTIKAIKLKKISSALQPYLEFIKEIVVNKDNPKKFIIYTNEPYFKAEESSGSEIFILPEYHYDANFDLRQISITALDSSDNITDSALVAFANAFSDQKFKEYEDYIVGSGPYQLVQWTGGSKPILRLERKKTWWGDQVENCTHLEAYPTSIVYKIIPDLGEAIEQLKKGELDIISAVPTAKFSKLSEDKKTKDLMELHATNQYAYHYIALNTKLSKFSDLRVRQAIAHAVDRKSLIKDAFNGYASLANGPVHPNKPYYNKDIPVLDFNLKKAAKLLKKAGWKDKDKNGIREKVINGETVELEFSILYNQGHSIRKAVASALKEALIKIGVNVIIEAQDFPTVLDNVQEKDFDSYTLGWVTPSGLDDLAQLWHSESGIEYGSNRTGFNSPECDQLIDQLKECLDPEERKKLYKEIQLLIIKEQHYVFLFIPNQLTIIRKGFEYPKLVSQRPGFTARLFKKKAN
jgi:peptide/nickel transport system substrate-binding protein